MEHEPEKEMRKEDPGGEPTDDLDTFKGAGKGSVATKFEGWRNHCSILGS